MKQCKIQSDEGVQLIKISLLRKRLRSELANLSHVSLGQRQVIVQEVQNIISFVDERNNMCMELAARKFYLEGWRQVLETLLATGSLSDLSYTNRWNILTQIVQDIFSKCLSAENTLPDLVHYLSGVMVILVASLRACALDGTSDPASSVPSLSVALDYVRCLDGTVLRTPAGNPMDYCFKSIQSLFIMFLCVYKF